ncbi:GNAT superfamily N-acetyltransferase [Streptomyces filamentosus]
MDVARWWAEGWAVSRRAPAPVDEPWGLRIDVGQPAQKVRHVLLGADGGTDVDPGTARALVGSLGEPTTCVKGFLAEDVMADWFPAGWEPVEACFLMAVDLRPARARVPEGYTVAVETEGGVTRAHVLTTDGRPAAVGQTGRSGPACVYDQIVTEPAHRRRGLGTVVMGALTDAAVEGGLSVGVLGATVPGRALYETLGWKTLAPLSGFVLRPAAL